MTRRYSHAKEVVWCQEEPMNQGAWFQIRHHLQACVGENQSLDYVGRRGSSSPAVGYYQVHQEQQKRVVSEALTNRKSTRLNSSHVAISYAVFCLKKKK